MRRWLSFSPGKTGCFRCGSTTNGNLYSAGWFSGQLWCAPCLNSLAAGVVSEPRPEDALTSLPTRHGGKTSVPADGRQVPERDNLGSLTTLAARSPSRTERGQS